MQRLRYLWPLVGVLLMAVVGFAVAGADDTRAGRPRESSPVSK